MNKASLDKTPLILSLSSTILHFSAASVYYKSCSEDIMNFALEIGLEYKFLAKLFYTPYQIKALEQGIPAKDAIKFDWFKISALNAGANTSDALKFFNLGQVRAFKSGLNLEDSLKFSEYYQVTAYQNGINLDDALKLTTQWAINAFKGGLTSDDAKKFGDSFDENLSHYNYSLIYDINPFCSYKNLLKVNNAMHEQQSEEALIKIISEYCPWYGD